jgi:hypothetical protein
MGVHTGLVGVDNAVWLFAVKEFYYPVFFGDVVAVDGVFQASRFWQWLVLLPIPKFLIGSGSSIYISTELTYLLTGAAPGDVSYSVVLVSVVNEGVYIFGRNWAWLMGLLLGAIFGLFSNLLGSVPSWRALLLFAGLQFAATSRAGFQGSMPYLINGFLLIIALAVSASFGRRKGIYQASSHRLGG